MPTTEETTQRQKHCIYCKKPMQPGEEKYWGFDDIEVCVECYKKLQEIKADRIEAYKKYYGKKGHDKE
jgi:hypothetical protein